MNIPSMLARLEHALGRADLAKQMVLLPRAAVVDTQPGEEINLVVGYNGSPQSQTALDLTLWIAHQTRLATSKQVTVQVVYVVNLEHECSPTQPTRRASSGRAVNKTANYSRKGIVANRATSKSWQRASSAVAEPPTRVSDPAMTVQSCQVDRFEQADRILWQARNLADEWRGFLKTHLRFGEVAKELRQVVQAESAALLLLGCESSDNLLVQQLGLDFPCPVLGIPLTL